MTDACIMITFGNVGALGVLTDLQCYQVITCPRAIAEVTRPPASEAVRQAVHDGTICVESIDLTDPVEQANLQRFDSHPGFRGRADAEILALAVSRDHLICSDELAVRRAASAELGGQRVAGALDVLVWGVTEGRLTVEEADSLLVRLDVGPSLVERLKRKRRTFKDLLAN